MVREIVSATILAAALTASMGWARAPEIEVLKRTDKWVLNYDRDACHLIGQFGTGDAMLAARFTRYQPSTHFDLALYGDRLGGERTDAKIDFGIGKPISAEGMGGKAGKLNAVFFPGMRLDGWSGVSRADVAPELSPAQEAATTGMTVTIRGKRPVRLDFGHLGKAMAQMRDCTTDLVRQWGYDPAVQAALTRKVEPTDSPQKWLRSTDFPTTAKWSGSDGIVQFRLDVDAEGKIAGCYILARTSPDLFADVTCDAIKRRAKLEPALDAQGKPVRSYFVQKVLWKAAS
ncbi:MAG: hypothetical protein EOP60_09565 [Sphingomonadales bacterium]|nr:MAG: hypothetical protein EOP60_09565 [Sphingomonadales bacterium]